ncbi:CRISPR-associated endonuclease Cas9 [Aquaticitalea lipolytica]|uniref:CRISPR-associated endonuclease Cas9 n=1 Tax=Aquaticitalea lipolytica TaxID=1247562 RepID=A0A8J2TRU5_9FLAO|nr:type II CRISPR RNA-guided endonuclease Cas9 [Aquaticitalea lipolytica]GFZ91057.1 CRISPR-associated endonuclease Cas9 [Aquaticitalea lipolytica]
MKKILGLDLGTNSIGWALVENDFSKKEGLIKGLGSRIIPMSQDVLGKFDSGVSISQTAERTGYRGVRRLIQRNLLRRERLHRVLNILDFLPRHYANSIDFEKRLGQFKGDSEVKLNYRKNKKGKHEFVFMDSFNEMVEEFKLSQPYIFYNKKNGEETKIPYDWTIYYLRKKALSQKIQKEELAWIIINFNQKRGYYQLRGEEEELSSDKTKEYFSLNVEKVIDSGETIKKGGEKLYDVFFSNGWKYDKQVVKTEKWIGKSKEFIVTTSTMKDGSIKRTYKAVNSEEDWIAIKKKTEQDIDNSNKTVGQYIYGALLQSPKQKIRGKLVKTIERKFYKEEFKKIIKEQIKHHPELQNEVLYDLCVQELYPRNEAHQQNIKNKDFEYLFTDDIIFYQRPLKSKKSTISGCQYETRSFKKKIIDKVTNEEKEIWHKEPLKGISKSHPLFQEFRLWQFLKNLKIYQKEDENGNLIDQEITTDLLQTQEDWVELFDFLNTKKEVEQKQIIQFFVDKKLIDKKQKDNYRWNYVEDKKYPCNETKAQFISRLKKVKNIDVDTFLTIESELKLWHIIYSVKDKNEYEQAIRNFSIKNSIDVESFVENFKRFPPFKNDYAAYSEKAIKKILPLMRMGKYWNEFAIKQEVKNRIFDIIERLKTIDFDINKIDKSVADDDIPKQLLKSFIDFKDKNPLQGLNTYQACYLVYNRHSEANNITRWKTLEDINKYLNAFKQHSLRNPIVEQVVTETLRTVRDIWQHYGKGEENFFDEIHVELGREMKNPAKARESLTKRVTENENTNHRIKEILKELQNEGVAEVKPYSPSQQEILKIYEEGIYQSLETVDDTIEKIRKNNSPTKRDITKYKLWLEQGYISPYTGKTIPMSRLFTTDYQIEHVIPQSRYFDDSLSNKIICESEVNQLKDNQTAYEFIRNHGTEKVDLGAGKTVEVFTLEQYENHCNQYFKKNKPKLKKLLSEDIPEGFIQRQLNDSRYISKLIKGLLGNLVREENEQEATSKHIVPVTGAITSKLRQDWGLNDKWNELVAPRFQRLNAITNSDGFGYWDEKINAFRTQVPDEISKGFSKKRIDHRHHALDALVIACCTKKHTNYLNALNAENKNYGLRDSLLIKNENGHYTKYFQLPWNNFPTEAKSVLEKTIISFKQNTRVINKTNNKTWQWIEKDGQLKKILVKQTKGNNWAIRKPMHEETVSGIVNLAWVGTKKGNITTATRKTVDKTFTLSKIEKITDTGIQKILSNYLKQEKFKELNSKGEMSYNSDLAFSPEGIEYLNKNIKKFNEGKSHQPIFKVRIYENGSGRFKLGEGGDKKGKYVQGAPNLFFAIYWDENNKKRIYETIPLNEIIEHQKQIANLPKNERTSVPINHTKGQFLFSLSPNDLVYVPSDEEIDNPTLVDFNNLTNEQVESLYNVNDFSSTTCYFTPNPLAKAIREKEVDMSFNEKKRKITGSFDTKTASLNGVQIKDICIKLEVDRLGNIINIKND